MIRHGFRPDKWYDLPLKVRLVSVLVQPVNQGILLNAINPHHAQSRVRIKICGITRPEDAQLAAALGADAIGLVFYSESPRHVTIEQSREITATLPPFVCKTGLFVNPEEEDVRAVLGQVNLDLLQFHGEEDRQMCERYSKPYIKAVRMQKNTDLLQIAKEYQSAGALLVDTFVKGVKGGTGRIFDWSLIPVDVGKPLILAGGLTADNVADAVSKIRPYGVDVSGGVESDKGIKDANKLAEFIQEVRYAENQYR